ncbi:class I SAM-dependent methyltransferase [Salinimicrobium soli]|uniref:class I SAM-dependent methyltransferase n=1 Tax=Salinimicrobium soli TaxID=1254399 RepID=UPI003AAE812C
METKKEHWDKVYETKPCTEVSWYEPMPETSLACIAECNLEKDAAIIDIGGGDSFLAEFLVAREFTDVTVVDISEKAIERAKERLGENAEKINWIVADAVTFNPEKKYDLWHDRAAFHFLTKEEDVTQYMETVKRALKHGGFVILGTFSEKGPTRCSGLEIKQYSIGQMQKLFSDGFITMNCKNVDHKTPSGATQNFTFCTFKKE